MSTTLSSSTPWEWAAQEVQRRYQSQVAALSEHFEPLSASDLLAWAVSEFGDGLVLACSFGPEDLVLIDLLTAIRPQVRAFFLDTDFHFPETLQLQQQVLARYPHLQLEVFKPLLTPEEQAAQYGPELYRTNPDLCCNLRKVEPLNRALANCTTWITGMRREQAPTRANIGKVQWDGKRNRLKLNPLADWTSGQVWKYILDHGIPYNPLHDRNYPSIGCLPCTAPVEPGEDPRSGRWKGMAKTECGLHT
ncbi:phosphoadenylyl-sulfate reductase [Synechococcus sp. H65.1]|uniref:phosphoadenylyl-sulfate reductase n=1 Tax=unclassified Synechococcus TaxID=2626047 RepID=UPI0039C0294B